MTLMIIKYVAIRVTNPRCTSLFHKERATDIFAPLAAKKDYLYRHRYVFNNIIMEFDAEIALAEIHRAEILVQHHIRNADEATLRQIESIMEELRSYARKRIREVRRPDRWPWACSKCTLAWPEKAGSQSAICPDCSSTMQVKEVI